MQTNKPGTRYWYQDLRRAVFHNLNEYDPQVLDVDRWIERWAAFRPNVIVLSCGGHIAFYPTKLPHHHRSQFLGDRDLFGEYFRAAKRRGWRVICRVESNWANQEVWRERPEWFERDGAGQPVRNEETSWVLHTCLFSNYHTEQVPAIMREVVSRYDVDGFFTNSWPPTGLPYRCRCEQCLEFAGRSDSQLMERQRDRVLEICDRLSQVASESRPDRVYAVHISGATRAVLNIRQLSKTARLFIADHQGRSGDTPIWNCAQQGRVAHCALNGNPIVLGVGTNGGAWRHTAKSAAETTLWMAQALASGMVPRYTWLGGTPSDLRWLETGRQFFGWIADHQEHFANRRTLTNLAVVYSQRLNHLYSAPAATRGGYDAIASSSPSAPGDPSDFLQGMYYALLEGRFIFDFIHEDDLTPERLKKYSTVLLPNIALLSDENCRALRSYANAGGSLLATFETSLYDESGRPRENFGLADLFQIRRSGSRAGGYFNAAIERPHELLRGFAQTKLLPGGEWRVPLRPTADPILTTVPPYPRGIPELVYAEARSEMPYAGPHSAEPAVVMHEMGASRLVYFPGDIERSAWRSGNSDLSLLLQNAIRWVSRGQSPVTVSGEGMAEIFAWETAPGYAIHILNYNNPNMTRPWIRKGYPLGPQQVRVELPPGVRISRVELLAAGTKPRFRINERVLEFTVPHVDGYEIAALYRS
ncbi:MAG: beta-galactosidase trimerization domain-containing protein [Acidobacteria bacterium]|nr:beta-galactosidase trimerization domain-containing protein [Acidobacteriota bacterium]